MNCFHPLLRIIDRLAFLLISALLLSTVAVGSVPAAETDLRLQPVVTSASEIDYPPFCLVDDNGQAGGFSVELLRATLAAMGRDTTFRTGTWPEVRSWLEQGEVQALPLVGRTPEREELFDFTFPYMSLHGAIVVRAETDDIQTLDDLRGRQVAVMKGDNAEEFLRRKDRGIDIRTTPTFDIALQELSRGRYDAVVVQRLVALRLLQESGHTNLRIIDRPVEGFRQDFCFAVREGDRNTLALLNEGLALVMADGTYRHLHAKWFAALQLPSSGRIVFGGDHNFPPFEFLNAEGRPAGFNVDLTRAIARELGLDIEIRLGPWAEIRQELLRGEIDALQGMLYSTERDLKFDFTVPHTVINYIAVTRRGEAPPPKSFDDLKDMRIVAERNDLMHETLIERGLGGQLTLATTQQEALRRVATGEADCALVARLTAMDLIARHGWKNLEIGQRSILSPGYGYAVPKGHQALLSQLSEGLKLIDRTGEYRHIHQQWLGVYEETPATLKDFLRYAAVVLIPLGLLLLSSTLWSWSLRRQVAQRTAELRKSEEKYRLLADHTLDAIWTLSPELECTYINPAGLVLSGYTEDEWIGTSLADHCDPENLAKITGIIAGEIARGPESPGVIFEAVLLNKDRQPYPVEVHGKVVYDEQGQPVRLQGTTRDIAERKQAEQRLLRTRSLLDRVQHISRIGGWEWDVDHQEMFFTEAAYRLHDIDPDEDFPTGRPLMERCLLCYSKEDRLRIRAAFLRCIHEGVPYELECRLTTERGRQLWVRDAGEPVQRDGRTTKIVGSLQDITADKAIEERLRDQYQFIQTILDNLPIGLAVNSLDEGKTTYVNRNFEEIYGWPANELRDIDTFFEKVYPDEGYRQKVRSRILDDIASGDPNRMNWEDIEVTGRDGSTRIVAAKNIPLTGQNIMISTVQDISRRKKAMTSLLESEQRFRLLVESSPDAILVQTGRQIQYLNQSAVDLFGADAADQLVGTSLAGRIHPDLSALVTGRASGLDEQKKAFPPVEQVCLRLDGSPVNVEATAVPIHYQGADGSLVFLRDITERIEREEAHHNLQEQLAQAQKMESIGRLAGGVAHDFNNMLGVIMGYAELALDKVPPQQPLHADIREIMTAAKRSSEITRQLLAFASRQTVAPQVLDLNSSVEKTLTMLRRLIGEDIGLAWHPDAQLWPVRIDASQVDQIITNLCVNARDAIDGVGKVTIETGNAIFNDDYCADHVLCLPGEYVLLAVSDDGRGMDSVTMDKVFEPFFTTKQTGEGTGLGLATVYGIVKQNNGFINVYSEPAKGTTIKIYLPRHDGPIQATQPASTGETRIPLNCGETVLLVEDEAPVLKLGKKMLEALGYRVLTAAAPKEAISLAAEHAGSIALLLTDVVMPDMNGRELSNELTRFNQQMKTVFMSGYTANVIAHRGILQEGVHFLQKPFSLEELAVKVRVALDQA